MYITQTCFRDGYEKKEYIEDERKRRWFCVSKQFIIIVKLFHCMKNTIFHPKKKNS